jgi:hypothetical protein
MVAVRCPQDFAHILQRAGGVWEPGTRRWLVERRRIGPVIRALQRATDPLFRRAGLTLDDRQAKGAAERGRACYRVKASMCALVEVVDVKKLPHPRIHIQTQET